MSARLRKCRRLRGPQASMRDGEMTALFSEQLIGGVELTGRRSSPTIPWLMLHCKQRLYRIDHQFLSTPEKPILRS
jgi:hypothetical protein